MVASSTAGCGRSTVQQLHQSEPGEIDSSMQPALAAAEAASEAALPCFKVACTSSHAHAHALNSSENLSRHSPGGKRDQMSSRYRIFQNIANHMLHAPGGKSDRMSSRHRILNSCGRLQARPRHRMQILRRSTKMGAVMLAVSNIFSSLTEGGARSR